MDDKKKPFAAIYISKPRISQVTAVTLILLIAVVAVTFHMQESKRWNKQLAEITDLLQERRASLSEAEGRLRTVEEQLAEAEYKLENSPAFWQLQEPAGFFVDPADALSGRRMLKAVACSRMAGGFEPYVFYHTADRDVIEDFVQRDNYVLVGQAKWSADWDFSDEISEDFYTRDEALEMFPYTWSESKDWLSNEWSWYERLYAFCDETIIR